MTLCFRIHAETAQDGRVMAQIPELPGVTLLGVNRATVVRSIRALALNVVADRIRAGEEIDGVVFVE